MFVESGVGGGCGSVRVDGDGSEILTGLTEGQSEVGAGGTTVGTFSAGII